MTNAHLAAQQAAAQAQIDYHNREITRLQQEMADLRLQVDYEGVPYENLVGKRVTWTPEFNDWLAASGRVWYTCGLRVQHVQTSKDGLSLVANLVTEDERVIYGVPLAIAQRMRKAAGE